ncbi:MAG: TIM barrel protein [Thermoplasmata archaeon]|nr:TIM barrel protein [Thermoplasmata archaeon]
MNALHFGPAGVPLSSPKRSTIDGIMHVRTLGLDAMEMEFVRGVKMGENMAKDAGKVARENNVLLTAHGPYFINLNSDDKGKREASVRRIYQTARITWIAGGYSIVFHAAYYGKLSPQKTYENVKAELKTLLGILEDEGIDIWIRPETTGKRSQFGTLEEIVKLSEELPGILPCIDFAHLHARSLGKYNTYEEFYEILSYVEEHLGREALDNMHIHVSGIEYGKKGEIRHLNLKESDMNYESLLKVWREFDIKGVVISESPNLEEDALLLKKLYGDIK